MEQLDVSPARIARFTAFATMGALGTTQELASLCLNEIVDADSEIVAEETLSLVAVTTARAAEVGLRDHPDIASAVIEPLMDLPFLYRDYLIGGAMILQQEESLLDSTETIYGRLQRKQEFYSVHFAHDTFPGEVVLKDKMGLWMGRVSPPGLPETPTERLAKLDLVPILLTHLKLVLAFGRRGFND